MPWNWNPQLQQRLKGTSGAGVTHRAGRGDNMPVPKAGRKLIVWKRAEPEIKKMKLREIQAGEIHLKVTRVFIFYIYTHINIYKCVCVHIHTQSIYSYKCMYIVFSRRIRGKEWKSPGLDFSRSMVLSWISTPPCNGSTKGSAGSFPGLSGRLFDFLFHNLLLWIH